MKSFELSILIKSWLNLYIGRQFSTHFQCILPKVFYYIYNSCPSFALIFDFASFAGTNFREFRSQPNSFAVFMYGTRK